MGWLSRQSVSKWETDTSIPELGKLIQISEVFGISLDELVRGKEEEEMKNEQLNSDTYDVRSSLSTRKIIGFIFLTIGL
jgi:transcriptional regulator with XRE-family HTH domain